LGIPVVVGALTIVPGLLYAYYIHYRGYPPISFPRYFTGVYLGLGDKPADWSGPSWPDLQFAHLWFIQNLLAYSVRTRLPGTGGRLVRRLHRPSTARGDDAVLPRRPRPVRGSRMDGGVRRRCTSCLLARCRAAPTTGFPAGAVTATGRDQELAAGLT
jgi:hypothetical protein